MSDRKIVLELKDILAGYGGRSILNGLNFNVAAGEIHALLGGNGAGKTTTLNIFLGFLKPQQGEVRVCGIDAVAAPDEARRQIAYIPENVALYEHLSAVENADYLLALSGERHMPGTIKDAFAAAGLQENAWGQRLSGFSKGMRQKVAIAVALLRQVPVLLLDEPTSGLDPRATADFNALVAQVRDRGTAILMVTHDLLSAADVADHIVFLEGGRVINDVAASGAERFDVRALHARFQTGGEALAA
ncbi:MAG: ATP-binding cassette domain-containing protein [Novosphingobium sp.]